MSCERKELPSWCFMLIVIIELYTSTVIVFKTVFSVESSYELLSVLTGPPRYIVSIIAAYKMVGSEFWKYIILIDNLFYLGLLTVACYYFLLFGKGVSSVLTFLAWLNYVVIISLYNGHFRIILNKMKWTSSKVLAYKFTKIYGVAVYIGLGAMNTLDDSLGDMRELYLLFVFTTAAYLSEFINIITARDGTECAKWDYVIEDDEEETLQTSADANRSVELVANS